MAEAPLTVTLTLDHGDAVWLALLLLTLQRRGQWPINTTARRQWDRVTDRLLEAAVE